MRDRDQRRAEERRYEADVDYEVWRNGGSVDLVDRDRVRDRFNDGIDADATAITELHRQRRISRYDGWADEQQEEREPFPEEQFPEQQDWKELARRHRRAGGSNGRRRTTATVET